MLVLGGWGSASLVYVRMPLFFSFQLQVFGSVGVETPDLQIYHVNEEGIYTMRSNSFETNILRPIVMVFVLFSTPQGQVCEFQGF